MSQEEDPKLSDFLVTAFEFQLGPTTTTQENNDNDGNSWSGYDWKFSECGTPHPTPRSNYATLFVKYKNNNDNVDTIRLVRGHSSEEEELDEEDDRIRIYYYQDSLSASGDDSSSHYLRGVAYPQEDLVAVVDNVNDMGQEPDSTTNNSSSTTWTIGVFHVASQQDYEFACQLADKDPKHRVVLKHEETSLVLESQEEEDEEVVGPITLRTLTGMGPEEGPTVPDSPRFWHQRLSTRIELVSSIDQVVLAKCHLSYRDDQWDPWIGPCIEAMSVNPAHRGQGWLSILWHQGVVPFLRRNYPMVDYNDSLSGNGESIQVRVIHLLGSEIDIIDKKTTSLSIWDKDFYFGQVGFSILPRGLRTGVMNYMRPQDDQGIGYLSLQKEVEEVSRQPRVGARYCQTCGTISKECFACPKQCGGRVYYCTVKCQEEDALQHDQWCGLTRAQLHEVLVQKGRRVQDSKGEWRTIL